MGTNGDIVENLEIFAMATDPIYIGTGGYSIGRVDNTIVREPTTNVPKIPGSSLAGTWRYYATLEIIKQWQTKVNQTNNSNSVKSPRAFIIRKISESTDEKPETIFKREINEDNSNSYLSFEGNCYLDISCAGQDDNPRIEAKKEEIIKLIKAKDYKDCGHCGQCIVCKSFGFSKKDLSWQGQVFFSDLHIIFFPVFTTKGTKWVTTVSKLKEIKEIKEADPVEEPEDNKIGLLNSQSKNKHLNLGWLYLEVGKTYNHSKIYIDKTEFGNFKLKSEDVVVVPEALFSHIVNSNLEVRTSVSIDPITGAAKEQALFTSEAIPRGTIFYGNIRIFDKSGFKDTNGNQINLPSKEKIRKLLEESKHFYETLGIGGMTTRGFGRLKINFPNE